MASIQAVFTLTPARCATGYRGIRDINIGVTGRAGVTETNCP